MPRTFPTSRRTLVTALSCAAVLAALPGMATAQAYPTKPIRILVPLAPAP